MITPITYNRFDLDDMHRNMQDFINTISDEEIETIKRCLNRWDIWTESMRVE